MGGWSAIATTGSAQYHTFRICGWRAGAGPKNGQPDVGFAAAPDAEKRRRNLVRTLDFKQRRLLSIYNWESYRRMPGAVDALCGLVGGR
jgi:hypothetical protein